MFGSLLGLKGIAIASAVSLAVGFGAGVWVRDAFCDAAAADAQVRALARQLEAAQVAGFEDSKRASAAAADAANLEARIHALQGTDSVCLPAADADRLRDLWR